MNSETIILLKSFCRTCMNGDEEDGKENEDKNRNVISIFNKPESMECKNITIMELLLFTTPQLNIESGDMLPKIVCESCLERLISAYKFQKMCIRVEQKLRQMLKDENHVESQINKDPLKDCLIDISIENVADSQNINDLSNIIKIEMDEPLIDQNVSDFSNKSAIEVNDNIKFETNDNQWDDLNDSEETCEVDSDNEWDSQDYNTKSSKVVLKKGVHVLESSNNYKSCNYNMSNEDEKNPDMIDDCKVNSELSKNIKKDEIKKFECEECGNLLATRKSLMRHKRIHLRNIDDNITEGELTSEIIDESKKNVQFDESKKFVCDECGNRLATRKSLKRHKRIHLRPVVEGHRNSLVKTKYECEFCKKVFQQSSSLKDHLRTHTGEQPYLCSECGKAFKSLSNMKQHFLRHGSDRPYVCPDCPKRFPCLSDLASHKAVHNKTKSHVCDICGAAFVKPYLLKKHKMYHTGEKNHKCDYCEMRFVLADQCRRHMRTHTGEKPYKCKYCERAFAQSNDLIKHLRGHLGDNVYKCDLCPQGFRLQMDLRAHFNTHKNDDEETRARNLKALKDEEHRLQMKFGLVKCT